MLPLRFGKGNVDWQARINFDQLREKRVEKAQQFMAKYGIGSAIIYNHDRRRYVSYPWNHPYAKQVPAYFALLIRGAGFPYLTLHKGVDYEPVQEDCPWLEGRILTEKELLQPRTYRYTTPEIVKKQYPKAANQIKGLLEKHGVAKLPISIDFCNPHLIFALQDAGLKVVDGNSWMDECGMVKFDEEILLMKLAATVNEAGYGELVKGFRVGMTENQVQGLMAKGIYDAGGEYIEGWVVNAGDRSNPRCFNWSDRPCRPGEFLTVEACHVNYCGYKVCYDRTFLVGAKPTDLQRRLYQVAVDLHARFQSVLKPGITTHDLARLKPRARINFQFPAELKRFRVKFSNHSGGIGNAWDSGPHYYSTEDPEVEIQKNMTLTYHVRVRLADHETGGVAIENTYRVTEKGWENLCQWPYEEIMTIGL
jgi:Xaa-Pro aminopeptidase